jgi:hypothetical protein
MGFLQHGKGFAHPGGMAKVNLKLAEAALFDEPQKILGFQTLCGQWHRFRHADTLKTNAKRKREKVGMWCVLRGASGIRPPFVSLRHRKGKRLEEQVSARRIRGKVATLATMLVINNLSGYTTGYKFFEVATSLIDNDISGYTRFFAVFGGIKF